MPSTAVVARILQMCVRTWYTCWSVVGRGYFRAGLRPIRRRTLWTGWYSQVRGCCGLGGGGFRVSGPALTCVWVVGMAQIQGAVALVGQRGFIHWDRQSLASPRW